MVLNHCTSFVTIYQYVNLQVNLLGSIQVTVWTTEGRTDWVDGLGGVSQNTSGQVMDWLRLECGDQAT